MEPLEARSLLTTFSVINTNDSGAGSLRQAILDANDKVASPGLDTIAFNIPGDGVHTITPQSDLTITDPVTIDGYTQPGARANTLAIGSDAVLLIEIDGLGDANGTGFTLSGGDSTLRGLVINQFTTGVIANSDRNVIAGNFVGTDAAGVADLGNLLNGIVIVSGAGNLVGGASAAARNVVSGNVENNIVVGKDPELTPYPTGTILQGNYIGTTAAGTGRVDPRDSGIGIPFGINLGTGNGTIIGGTSALARNVISGNYNGIYTSGFDTDLTIQGNYIGVDATGSEALANRGIGISATNAGRVPSDRYTIGGTEDGAGNVISGNGQEGVYLTLHDLVFQGNFIGTNASGTAAIGNGNAGVRVAVFSTSDGPGDILIGGTTAAARNVIAGNGDVPGTSRGGIFLEGYQEGTRLVQGNFIGTLADGTTPAGNTGYGVESSGRATIGGASVGSGNVIANNTSAGVIVGGSAVVDTTGVSILGNSIYSNAAAGIALGVDVSGVIFPPRTNDPGDADDGPNNFQNYPLVSSVVLSAGGAMVNGTLNSQPSTAYAIEFFSNVSLDPAVPNGRQTFLGTTTVTTDAAGNIAFSAQVAAPPAGQSLVTATATDPDGNTSIFSIIPAVVVIPVTNADLAVTIGGTPDPVVAGAVLSYAITLTNAGPNDAQGVTLTDAIPANTTFLSFTAPPGWTATTPTVGGAGNVSAIVASLANGAVATFTLSVRVSPDTPGGSTITDTSTVSATTDDPNPANNSATGSVGVVTPVVPTADLAVTATAGPGPLIVGDSVVYTIIGTNLGPDAATGAVLTDTLPAGVDFVSASVGTFDPASRTLTASLGNLGAGSRATVTITARASAAGMLTDIAHIQGNEADPDPANNSSSTTIAVNSPSSPASVDLAVVGLASPEPVVLGQDLTYTLTVAVRGASGPATGVTLVDTLPVGVDFVSTSQGRFDPTLRTITADLGTLAAGASDTVTIVVRPTTAGVLEDTAAATANENDPDLANNRVVVPSTVATPTPLVPGTVGTPTPLAPEASPMVLSVQRFGIHAQPTRLVLRFSAPLDPARAQDPSSYRIIGPGGRAIAVDSAVYDAAARSVTLHPHTRLDVHRRYRLTAYGTGPRALAGTSGVLLDGTRTGRPGSDFATIVDRSVLVLPDSTHTGVRSRLSRNGFQSPSR